MVLDYIDAQAVQERLDQVCGPEGWQDEYRPTQGGFICRLSIRCGEDWIAKEDGADVSAIEPTKGGVSDSFKRAAVKWGIGRYLYDLPSVWMPCEKKGKTVVPKQTPPCSNTVRTGLFGLLAREKAKKITNSSFGVGRRWQTEKVFLARTPPLRRLRSRRDQVARQGMSPGSGNSRRLIRHKETPGD